jgi:hypothetical protein
VDPVSGLRSLVWQAQWTSSGGRSGDITGEYGQCLCHGLGAGSPAISSSVFLSNSAFAVTEDGFYLAFDDGRAGTGTVKISLDGSECDMLARWGGRRSRNVTAPDIGGGYDPSDTDLRGMLVHDNKLYVVQVLTNDLISIELEDSAELNTDEHDSPILVCDYGVVRSVNSAMIGRGNGIHYGTVVLDPLDNNKAWFTLEPAAMGVLEPWTFNSMVMSW